MLLLQKDFERGMKMKKILKNLVFIIYVMIAVFVTICLLSYNDYKISEIGQTSLLIIDSNQLEPNYQRGDLVLINKKDSIKKGDQIFFYNTYSRSLEVTLATVTDIEQIGSTNATYTLEGGIMISNEYVLGPANTTTRIPVMGSVLNVLESKWGFLFLIVFPSLVAFLYEIYIVVLEIKEMKQIEETK